VDLLLGNFLLVVHYPLLDVLSLVGIGGCILLVIFRKREVVVIFILLFELVTFIVGLVLVIVMSILGLVSPFIHVCRVDCFHSILVPLASLILVVISTRCCWVVQAVVILIVAICIGVII
jgi:hypothetical protein